MPSPAPEIATKVGVLLYDKTVDIDAVLASAVQRIRAQGTSVGGLLQRQGALQSNGKHEVWLDDIETGQSIRIDEPRGPGARACILDPDGLAQASLLLRATTESAPALIVVNRFGHAEANGEGLRAEIAEAICSGAALLVAVRPARLQALEDFLGAPPTTLKLSPDAIADWAARLALV
jgi:hypothetical protein